MSTPPKLRRRPPKTISIQLSADDQEIISKIAREYGLIKDTDCLRLALREALRRIESQQTTAAVA